MTNSRELAEQAFALLQDALEESEAQRSELEARLLKGQTPDDDPQAQLRRLAEQLRLAEQERAQWHKTANQLHDVVANERAKNRRLAERVETAESGTDKNLRKEINYWRQKAEEFSAARQEFQQRIFALKTELATAEERFEARERETGSAAERERLQAQLSEREQQLSELHAAFEGSKLRCSELEVRITDETQERGRLTEHREALESACRQAEEARDRLQGELDSLRAERDGIAAAKAEAEQQVAQVRGELEQRLAQVRSELEQRLAHERGELEQRVAQAYAERDGARHELESLGHRLAEVQSQGDASRGTIEALQHELGLVQQQLVESQTAGDEERRSVEALRGELGQVRADVDAKQQAIDRLERELAEARDHGGHRDELDALEQQLADARGAVEARAEELEGTQQALAEARTHAERAAAELESVRQQLAEARGERERDTEELDTLRRQLAEARSGGESTAQELARLEQALEETRAASSGMSAELESAQRQVEETEAAKARAEQEIDALNETLGTLRSSDAARADEIAAVRDELEELQTQLTRDEDVMAELREQLAVSQASATAARAQLAELDEALGDEKARSRSLSDLATSRQAEMTRLTEKLEETQEHYEETKWQLGKARHFEKLVRRRKKLIGRLIGNIRAKQKATNALKAGLDSLRRYKANADQKQQELLRRIEMLEQSLSEAREKLGKAQNSKRSSDKAPETPGETARLRTQLAAQTEVIRSLEQDLKRTRLAEAEMRSKTLEVERLADDIATKNTFIGSLQKDIEEHQRVQAQLRKREIELRELGERMAERDKKLAELAKENEALRAAGPSGGDNIDRNKVAALEKRTMQLAQQLKQYETQISTLNQDVDRWKRKYEFLAADTPYGLDNAAGKK